MFAARTSCWIDNPASNKFKDCSNLKHADFAMVFNLCDDFVPTDNMCSFTDCMAERPYGPGDAFHDSVHEGLCWQG